MLFYELNWKQMDPEAKFGFPAKKFTAVNNWFSMIVGLLMTFVFYGILYIFHVPASNPDYQKKQIQMVEMFFHGGVEGRSSIPYFTVFFTCWCLAFLLIKWLKLRVQAKALEVKLIPEDSDYVISPMNAQELLVSLNNTINKTSDFMLLWRIECALSNLKNIGRVSDVSALLSDLADNDTNYIENSYTLPKGLIWAIPVLGFIGTVLGLSQAVGGFGSVVAGGADLTALKNALGGVTGGLATAFETTLIALVAALIVQLLMTLLQQKEEEFLDRCAGYCHQNITSKLKMIYIADENEQK